MLTCITRSKQADDESPKQYDVYGGAKNQSIKSLTTQIKDMALKASGAYKSCNPCTGPSSRSHHREGSRLSGSDWTSDRFRRSYHWTGSSAPATMRLNLAGLSSGEGTPSSTSSRRVDPPIVFMEESEPREWEAQVEPGVLITFVSMPRGGNDLRRIRFSRELFNKFQAQRWWAENYDKVMELYNVQSYSHRAFRLPTPPRSDDESSNMESVEQSPLTPPLATERPPRNLHHPMGVGMAYSSSDSLEHPAMMQARHYHDSGGLTTTPKLSRLSGMRTEASSMDDGSMRSSSSREVDRSISNASDLEAEWIEEDEPGVYITIRALPNGRRELRRVRFSREIFGEVQARVWWEKNRARIHEQYL